MAEENKPTEDESIPPHDYRFKIVLVGDPGVGKTSLLLRYCEERFPETDVMNVGVDYKSKLIDVDGKTVYLEIWDTAGQERYRTITASFYKGAHGIILVYDLTDEETFYNLNSWLSEIDHNLFENSDAKKFLIGNKTDAITASRPTQKSAASDLASRTDMEYHETSAKEGTNVSETFLSLVQGLIESGQTGRNPNSRGVIQVTATSRRGSEKPGGGKCCSKT